ncbi:hypothetical protein V6N12_068418 [Hibiscus sabdariffa]|uniref:Uncharacterized protein n=1 Tax=Hibiscus sabdariffa TaxID=183260 RepID=A0ABR2FPW3_9ROSI
MPHIAPNHMSRHGNSRNALHTSNNGLRCVYVRCNPQEALDARSAHNGNLRAILHGCCHSSHNGGYNDSSENQKLRQQSKSYKHKKHHKLNKCFVLVWENG